MKKPDNLSKTAPFLTISPDGKPPSSRLTSPLAVQNLVDSLVQADGPRNEIDAQVYGMISGRQPYSASLLRKNGQSWRSNFPTRIAEAFFDTAKTIFYDVVSSALTFATVRTEYGQDADAREDMSNIITEEFERLNRQDKSLNSMFLNSQHDMVLYRYGPVVWMDEFTYKAKRIPQEHLYVPEGTLSDVGDWPYFAVRLNYQVHELFPYILNPEAAAKRGWDVQEVRRAIMEAAPEETWQGATKYDWLWYEKRLRANDLWLGKNSEVIPVAWLFWREFEQDGKPSISKCAIIDGKAQDRFLFRQERVYETFHQCVNAFYYDTGNGQHHSVKGMGVKCFHLLATYDRLQNHTVDLGFASALHFKSVTANALEELSVAPMGPFMFHQSQMEYIPMPNLGQMMDAPLQVKDDLLKTTVSNLSQYRPGQQKSGNPITAREVEFQAENQNIIGRAQLNRYFEQLDLFWEERYRRVVKLAANMPGGKECEEFRKRCLKRGVPLEALQKVESVTATRSIGYGSADARMQALNRMLARYGLYDETGKKRLLEDITAADVGQSLMRRYIPAGGSLSSDMMEQQAEARQWVGVMKANVPPVITPRQNPMVFATEFLKAASESAASLQQGANPKEVYNFMDLAGQAIIAHIQRMQADPTRAMEVKMLTEQWKKLASVHDQLKAKLQQEAQQQQQMMAQRQEQMMALQSDQALKQQEMQGKMALQTEKTQHQMALKQQTTEQKMRLADLTTAAKVTLQKQTAKAKESE